MKRGGGEGGSVEMHSNVGVKRARDAFKFGAGRFRSLKVVPMYENDGCLMWDWV